MERGEGRVTEGLAWILDFILEATRKGLRVCVLCKGHCDCRGLGAGQPRVCLTKDQKPQKNSGRAQLLGGALVLTSPSTGSCSPVPHISPGFQGTHTGATETRFEMGAWARTYFLCVSISNQGCVAVTFPVARLPDLDRPTPAACPASGTEFLPVWTPAHPPLSHWPLSPEASPPRANSSSLPDFQEPSRASSPGPILESRLGPLH